MCDIDMTAIYESGAAVFVSTHSLRPETNWKDLSTFNQMGIEAETSKIAAPSTHSHRATQVANQTKYQNNRNKNTSLLFI